MASSQPASPPATASPKPPIAAKPTDPTSAANNPPAPTNAPSAPSPSTSNAPPAATNSPTPDNPPNQHTSNSQTSDPVKSTVPSNNSAPTQTPTNRNQTSTANNNARSRPVSNSQNVNGSSALAQSSESKISSNSDSEGGSSPSVLGPVLGSLLSVLLIILGAVGVVKFLHRRRLKQRKCREAQRLRSSKFGFLGEKKGDQPIYDSKNNININNNNNRTSIEATLAADLERLRNLDLQVTGMYDHQTNNYHKDHHNAILIRSNTEAPPRPPQAKLARKPTYLQKQSMQRSLDLPRSQSKTGFEFGSDPNIAAAAPAYQAEEIIQGGSQGANNPRQPSPRLPAANGGGPMTTSGDGASMLPSMDQASPPSTICLTVPSDPNHHLSRSKLKLDTIETHLYNNNDNNDDDDRYYNKNSWPQSPSITNSTSLLTDTSSPLAKDINFNSLSSLSSLLSESTLSSNRNSTSAFTTHFNSSLPLQRSIQLALLDVEFDTDHDDQKTTIDRRPLGFYPSFTMTEPVPGPGKRSEGTTVASEGTRKAFLADEKISQIPI